MDQLKHALTHLFALVTLDCFDYARDIILTLDANLEN